MTQKKPKPPDNLWETLDREVRKIAPVIPLGAFSFAEFKRRYNITSSIATNRLAKLLVSGKIRRVCLGWYVLAEKEKEK